MTTPSLTVVRPARVEDIPALVPLVERYWAFEEVAGFDAANTARALQALLADERSGAGWMVVEGTTIVGSLLAVYVFSLEHGGLTVEIDEFFLDEGWRGAGLGRQFLETAEAALLLERVVPHRPPQPCRALLLRTAGLPIRRRLRPDGEAAALESSAPKRAVLTYIDVYVYYADVPLASLSNPVVLPLLGLLVEQPAHPYELTRRLADRYPTLQVRRSTVTTLTRSLAARGLIEPGSPTRVGRRPPRTTYQLTAAGFEHLRRTIVRDLLEARAASRRFTFALAYAGLLPAGETSAILTARLERLQREARLMAATHGLPEYQMLEADYWCAVLDAEHRWIVRFVSRLNSGDIDWPSGHPSSGPEGRTP